ncbi:PIG-L deacetylase family protein [Nocardioides sp.]|uniref:PIG-L deacetylase family protein n=1 Tax=Nocardioides sp. TaxID=35761 RepID=UPI0037838080
MSTYGEPAAPPSVAGIATLLGVWAHPDDEAYLSSGLMSVVRDAGGRVAVVTATRGEQGTDDPEAWPPERLAPVREHELRASLAEVGVREHHWLSYRDGELAGVPLERGATEVAAVIDVVRPDVVVTFGPDGMTGHADHRAVSAWTTEAWRRTGRRAELWYATLTPEFHREWGDLNDRVGLWMDAPPVTARSQLVAELRLVGRRLVRKHRALRAHASQTRVLEQLVGPATYRSWWSTESFVAAPTG